MCIKENGTILIPTDFSDQSLNAIKNAFNIGRFTNSKLLLLHTFQKPEEEQNERLKQLAEQTAKESGLLCTCISKKGNIFDETVKLAKEMNANLIVSGCEISARLRTFTGNSTLNNFIKNAPCQVLTVRTSEYTPGCKNIVMPFDLSPESREKVPTTIQIAKYFNADIRIVSIFDPNDIKYENKLLPYLQQVKQFIKSRSVRCTNKSIPSRYPVESIIDYANRNNSELIVQMNTKTTGFGELIGGTLSQKIIDTSNIPVLTINPMKRESLSHFGSGL
jgi:nucleotide-binding universal stress UspA family protein